MTYLFILPNAITRIKCFGHRLNTFGKTFCKCERWVQFMHELHTIIETVKGSDQFSAALTRQQTIRIGTIPENERTRKDVPKGPIRGSSTRWTYGPRFLQRALEIFGDIAAISGNIDQLSVLLQRDMVKLTQFLDYIEKVRDKFALLQLFSRFFNRIHFWLLITETASLPTSSWVIYAIKDLSLLMRNISTFLDIKRNETADGILAEQFRIAVRIMRNVHAVFKNVFINDARGHEDVNDPFFLANDVLLAAKVLDIRTMYFGNGTNPAEFDTKSVKNVHFEPVFRLYQFMETQQKVPTQQRVTEPPTVPVDDNVTEDDIVIMDDEVVRTGSVRNIVDHNNNLQNCFNAERDNFKLHCNASVHGLKREQIMNLNPLQFWKGEICNNGQCNLREKFPMLFTVAMMVLAVPAQSASSERVFSSMTSIISNRRQSLGVNRAAALIDSSFSHRCAEFGARRKIKQKEKLNKRQIKFPLFGSYGDLSDLNFELIDEDDDDYTPDDDHEDDDDELFENNLEGFLVPENWDDLQLQMNYEDDAEDNAMLHNTGNGDSLSAEVNSGTSNHDDYTTGNPVPLSGKRQRVDNRRYLE